MSGPEQETLLCAHKQVAEVHQFVSSLMGVYKTLAFICFGHYWPPSEGRANTTEKLLDVRSMK
jgi:hypothetical protein